MAGWSVALLGGILIGLSASLLLWFNGRIAGISGIMHGLASRELFSRIAVADWGWRIAFLAGLMLAGAIAMHALGQSTPSPVGTPVLVLAGLLVGFGTRMGGGCTSGHGVCGLGRVSKRSLAAVLVFMAAAMLTVYFMRHLTGVGS